MQRRRNGDESRRDRERRARAEGVGGEAVLVDLMRAGVPVEAVEYAAVLGDEAARVAVPEWRRSVPPGWIGAARDDAAVILRPEHVNFVAYFLTRESWGAPILDEVYRRSLGRVDAITGGAPPTVVRQSLDEGLRLKAAYSVDFALEQLRHAVADAVAYAAGAYAFEHSPQRTAAEGAGTRAWAAELQAQRDDLVALLLQRPLVAIVASNPPGYEGLSYLLGPRGKVSQIGPERGHTPRNGIAVWKSREGSVRYVMIVDGQPVSAIQVMARGGHGVVANAYTRPDARRHGHGRALVARARRDFTLSFGEDRSDDGAGFVRGVETNPPELPVPASRQHFLPALATSGRLPRGEYVPPVTSFELATSGATPLVYVPEGSYENEKANAALAALITTPGALAAPGAWDDLIARVGTRATVYLIDRRGEQWRVRDVVYYPGGRDGALDVEHLGRRGRMRVDLREAYGHVLPVLVYKPLRANPARMRAHYSNPGDDDLRRLQRAALEQPGDVQAQSAYLAAWRRAGSPDQWPDRDPRKHPLEGDVVDNETQRGGTWGRTDPDFRRYRVSATGMREEQTIVGPKQTPFVLFEWLGNIDRNDFWREKGLLRDDLGRVDASGNAPLHFVLPQADPGRHRQVLPASWRAWAREGHVVERVPSPWPKPPRAKRTKKNPPRGDDRLRDLQRRAATGDRDAHAALEHERERHGCRHWSDYMITGEPCDYPLCRARGVLAAMPPDVRDVYAAARAAARAATSAEDADYHVMAMRGPQSSLRGAGLRTYWMILDNASSGRVKPLMRYDDDGSWHIMHVPWTDYEPLDVVDPVMAATREWSKLRVR